MKGIVVEIDESAFGKRKYHRGKVRNTQWVFGGVERGSNMEKVFMVPVPNRKRSTLWPLIFKHIAPGSIIMSDSWKAYDGIGNHNGYTHLKVNHSVNFVDPITGAHTETIEGSWFHAKRSMPRHGTRRTMFASYFASFIWYRRYGGKYCLNRYETFIRHIAQVFNPDRAEDFEYYQTQDQPMFDLDYEELNVDGAEDDERDEGERLVQEEAEALDGLSENEFVL